MNKKEIANIDVDKVQECPTCRKWMAICLTEPNFETHRKYEAWIKSKQKFWAENKVYLESMGFHYESAMSKALDFIELSKQQRKDLEGCLLVVKIGSDARPASPQEIEITQKIFSEALDDVKGIRVIITASSFNMEKVSLPQLRRLQSEVLSSFETNESSNPIINLEII